jgi:hypothetical protein
MEAKLRPILTAMLLAAFISSGCLEESHHLSLQENGSADLRVSYGMPDNMVAQIKQAARWHAELNSMNTTNKTEFVNPYLFDTELIKQAVKSYEDLGVSVSDLSIEKKNSWHYAHYTIHFKDFSQISKLSDCALLANHDYSLHKLEDGNYVLNHNTPGAGLGGGVDVNDAEAMQTLSPMLAGLRVSLKMETPGRIQKSNGHAVSIRDASWDYSFDKAPKSIQNIQNDIRSIIFEGNGLNLKDASLKHTR